MIDTRERPKRLAAPAPMRDDEPMPLDADDLKRDRNLDAICWQWAAWVRSRRIYVRNSAPASLLGRLRSPGAGRITNGGPDAACSAELSAFHLAYLGQPSESLDRRVFELHYYWEARNIKACAAELGIGRQHWYTLIADFRKRVWAASRDIYALNMSARQSLPSERPG